LSTKFVSGKQLERWPHALRLLCPGPGASRWLRRRHSQSGLSVVKDKIQTADHNISWCIYPVVYLVRMLGIKADSAVVSIQVGFCAQYISSKCGVDIQTYQITGAKPDKEDRQKKLSSALSVRDIHASLPGYMLGQSPDIVRLRLFSSRLCAKSRPHFLREKREGGHHALRLLRESSREDSRTMAARPPTSSACQSIQIGRCTIPSGEAPLTAPRCGALTTFEGPWTF
jgi:hypothetical protein